MMLVLSDSRYLLESSGDERQREGEQKYLFALYFSKVHNVFLKMASYMHTISLSVLAGAETTISMVVTLKLIRVK